MGATVWHGSPHKFSKFDSSKIGTGEGAQAFGHGLYLAENPDVAKGYVKSTSGQDFIRKVRNTYDSDNSPEEALDMLLKSKDFTPAHKELIRAVNEDGNLGFDYPHQGVQAALHHGKDYDLSERTQKAVGDLGSLYKVDLPDEHIAKMLDWG